MDQLSNGQKERKKIADVFLQFSHDHLTLCIRRALSPSSVEHTARIGQNGWLSWYPVERVTQLTVKTATGRL